MESNDAIRTCRGCGAEVMTVRTSSFYRRVIVEAEPQWIRQAVGGEEYITIHGEVIHGFPAGDADDDPDSNLIPAYIPHKGRCQNNGRKPRSRRRPSGSR